MHNLITDYYQGFLDDVVSRPIVYVSAVPEFLNVGGKKSRMACQLHVHGARFSDE